MIVDIILILLFIIEELKSGVQRAGDRHVELAGSIAEVTRGFPEQAR